MDNNLENKGRFFAQYWRLPVGRKKLYENLNYVINGYIIETLDFIELKPLSSITDEDAIEVAKIRWSSLGNNHPYKKSAEEGKKVVDTIGYCSADNYTMLKMFDYLRSKSYALPYMGLSIEQQIEYGWLKLTDK